MSSSSSCYIKSWKHTTIHVNIHLYLSVHNAENILIKTEKQNDFNFAEPSNIFNYKPTADTVHVDVRVARIA